MSRLAEDQKSRKILTPEEVRKFFAQKMDERFLGINLLAATTGMRLGECRGLLAENVHEDWIDIVWNWQDREGLKKPKWGSSRAVPIPPRTYEALHQLIEKNPWKSGFVFYGEDAAKPISRSLVAKNHTATLEAIGIKDHQERGLSFHAWRHWYNSMLRGSIPDHALRGLTGHRSDAMTDRYSEVTQEQREAILKLAGNLF
jgi:integrase